MRKMIIRASGSLLAVLLLVFITGSVLAAPSDPQTNNMNGMNMAPAGPKEVPLGAPSTDPNGAGTPNLDLQMPANSNSSSGGEMAGMDMGGMMSMMGSMMGMGNMNNMSGTNSGAMSGVNPAVLTQLQSSNAMIMQMLNTLSSQPNNSNVQQLLYQMLTNQTALIQMLYSSFMNMGQNNSSSNSSSMGGMSSMGMM